MVIRYINDTLSTPIVQWSNFSCWWQVLEWTPFHGYIFFTVFHSNLFQPFLANVFRFYFCSKQGSKETRKEVRREGKKKGSKQTRKGKSTGGSSSSNGSSRSDCSHSILVFCDVMGLYHRSSNHLGKNSKM